MDTSIFILVTAALSFMLFIFQRAEPKKRLIVFLILIGAGELIRRYVVYREANTEGVLALVTALVLNFMFWALIGRYNPVRTSDEIKVYGLDD